MNILQWIGLSQVQTKEETDRIDRYQYAIQEVKRWTQAKQAWIKSEMQAHQELEEQIADLDRRAGVNSGASEGLRRYLADCRHRLELDLQEADYRLTIYRNIVLMQGRV